jgi:predicted dehydrogenase
MEIQMAGGEADTRTWDGYGYPGLPTVAAGLEEFARAIEEDRPAPISPAHIQHGINVLAAIVDSSKTNTLVAINQGNGS